MNTSHDKPLVNLDQVIDQLTKGEWDSENFHQSQPTFFSDSHILEFLCLLEACAVFKADSIQFLKEQEPHSLKSGRRLLSEEPKGMIS